MLENKSIATLNDTLHAGLRNLDNWRVVTYDKPVQPKGLPTFTGHLCATDGVRGLLKLLDGTGHLTHFDGLVIARTNEPLPKLLTKAAQKISQRNEKQTKKQRRRRTDDIIKDYV